jgi:hypothetical protein
MSNSFRWLVGLWRWMVTRIEHVFSNPYFLAASILARLLVNWACFAWGLAVLYFDNALAPTSYAWIGEHVHENIIAWTMIIVAVVQTLWLLCHWKPRRFGGAGYIAQMIWWLFIFYSIILANPAQPTSISGISTVLIIAVFASMSWPRNAKPD